MRTTVAVVDSGGANISSVLFALERLDADARLTRDRAEIEAADRVVLPGVGAAAPAMARLHEFDLVETLRSVTSPLLGVCLGMQLLFEHSEEGDTPLLGLLPGRVGLIPATPEARVPHMGWNRLLVHRADALTAGVHDGEHAYFVHSYAAPVTEDTIASVRHGGDWTAVVGRGHLRGVQFHPERSASLGRRMLQNFLTRGVA